MAFDATKCWLLDAALELYNNMSSSGTHEARYQILHLSHGETMYTIDLGKLEQRNLATGFVRRIRKL